MKDVINGDGQRFPDVHRGNTVNFWALWASLKHTTFAPGDWGRE